MSTVEVSPSVAADLEGARAALELADGVIATAIARLTELAMERECKAPDGAAR